MDTLLINPERDELARESTVAAESAGPAGGLTSDQAKQRLAEHGFNELPEHRVNPLLKFLTYFWGPIPWMIEIAAILSAILGHWPDLCIISALLVVNACVGFWEEFQAGNAIEALKSKLAATARVLRDGKWGEVIARELVPGDTVRIRIGDVVPADLRLLHGDPVEVDQSALTGESLTVSRHEGEEVYSGSVIKRGDALAVVSATGADTFFGKTAKLVAEAKVVSHFQQAVLHIGNYLILFAIALVALLLIVAIHRGDSLLQTIQFALVLAVSGVPVAMPAVLSVTMAVGARLLARKNAVVSRLAAIEEMAGIDILCSDKTGTLTKNELTLRDVHTLATADEQNVLLAASLASKAEDNDPIDLAVLGGLKDPALLEACRVSHFRPFDPVSKRTEAEVAAPDGATFKTSKGAPQMILELIADPDTVREEVERTVQANARRGFRSLGVARTDAAGAWQYLGILSLYDPPRDDSRETIDHVQQMGLKVKMVTGDQVAIARETCEQLGLGTNIFDAGTLEESKQYQQAEINDRIERSDGFAQVFPEHKYHVVDVLQSKGHIVGMTGDGVNDAPALKKADAGIAVSGATDAARAAADVVLMTPGLSVISDAIAESRRIFERMTNYSIYRITETIRLLLFMALAILVLNFYPVTALMIVLLAILNDGAILTIAYDRVPSSPHPRRWDMRLVLGVATILGTLGVAETFGLFYLADRVLALPVADGESKMAFIRTLIYLKLSVSGHLTVFVARTRGPFFSSRPAGVMMAAIFCNQSLATLISVYGIFGITPIGWTFAGIVWGYSLAAFLCEDMAKLVAVRIFGEEQPGILLEAKSKPALPALST